MKKRVHTKASDWLPLIEEWRHSGCSKQIFCEQKQIPYKKFYRWYHRIELSRLAKAKPLTAPAVFVPLKVTGAVGLGSGAESCVLRLSSQLQLQIPLTALTIDFLHILFESVGIRPC